MKFDIGQVWKNKNATIILRKSPPGSVRYYRKNGSAEYFSCILDEEDFREMMELQQFKLSEKEKKIV